MMSFFSCIADMQTASRPDRVTLLAAYIGDADPDDASMAISLLAGEGTFLKISPKRAAAMTVEHLGAETLQAARAAGADALETLTLLMPEGDGNGGPVGRFPELLNPSRSVTDSQLCRMIAAVSFEDRPGLLEILSGRVAGLLAIPEIWQALSQATGWPVERVAANWFSDHVPYTRLMMRLRASDESDEAHRNELVPRLFEKVEPIDADTAFWQSQPDPDWAYFRVVSGERVQVVSGPGALIVDTMGRRLNDTFPELIADLVPAAPALLEGVLHARAGELSTRLARKKTGPAIIRDNPVDLTVHDLLAMDGCRMNDAVRADRLQALAEWHGNHAPQWMLFPQMHSGSPPAEAGLMVVAASRAQGVWITTPPLKTAVAPIIYVKLDRWGDIAECVLGMEKAGTMVPIGAVVPELSPVDRDMLINWTRQKSIERFGTVYAVPPERFAVFRYRDALRAPRRKAGFSLTCMAFLSLQGDDMCGEYDLFNEFSLIGD